jgi:hypothetical protein
MTPILHPHNAKVVVGLVVVLVALLAGCGGSSAPNAEKLREERDSLKAELLLNSVEIIRAESEEAPRNAITHAPQAFLKRARKVERMCKEGDYLESCRDLAAIESVVASMK